MSLAFSWIEDNRLAASSCPRRGELLEIKDYGVSAILTLTEAPLANLTRTSDAYIKGMGFETLHAPIIDMRAPDETLARRACVWIDSMLETDKPVLLHCLGGIGRTGTILHAYYLLKGEPLEAVKARIKVARPMSSFDSLTKVQQEFLNNLVSK